MAMTAYEKRVVTWFYFGVVTTIVGIVAEAILTCRVIWKIDKSSDKFLKDGYLRFLPRAMNLANYIIFLLYSLPVLFIRFNAYIGLSVIGIVAESVMIGFILYFVRVPSRRRERYVLLGFVAIAITFDAIVIAIAMIHYPPTHHRRDRGKFVGVVLSVFEFIILVVVSADMIMTCRAHAISEVSKFVSILGFFGNGELTVYAYMTQRKIMAIRHGIACAIYIMMLATISIHYLIVRLRPAPRDEIEMADLSLSQDEFRGLVRFMDEQSVILDRVIAFHIHQGHTPVDVARVLDGHSPTRPSTPPVGSSPAPREEIQTTPYALSRADLQVFSDFIEWQNGEIDRLIASCDRRRDRLRERASILDDHSYPRASTSVPEIVEIGDDV